jgi:hypothetical protein
LSSCLGRQSHVRKGLNVQEEREEKALRVAEMEATKAENMMEHAAAIAARPARAWFMSAREKAAFAAAVPAPNEDGTNGGESGKGGKAARAVAKAAKGAREAQRTAAKGVACIPGSSFVCTCVICSSDDAYVVQIQV